MRNALVVGICAALLLITSCKKESAPPAAASGPGNGKITIVFIPKNTGNPYFDPMIDGFKKAADENGDDFNTEAPATADATSQLSIIKNQIQRGVNVLALAPNSPDALNAALKEAMGKGITVLTVDSDTDGFPDARNAAVKTCDPDGIGKGQVELMGSLIDYKGKIAILSATTDAPNQNAWIAVMKKALSDDPKYKDMQLVDVVYGNDEPQKSLTECEALLTRYPDLRGIISPTTVGIAAAAQCVESAGKASQIQVTGLGTPNQMRRYIKNSTVKAFQLWSPYDEGYLACQLGIGIATGKIKPAAGADFQAGTLGSRQFIQDNVVITEQPVTFTADNIDKFNF